MRKTATILVLFVLVATLVGVPASSQSPEAALAETRYTPGVVWVKLAQGVDTAAEREGEWQSFPVSGRLTETSWVRLDVPQGQEEAFAHTLRQRADVQSAEPEYLVTIAAVPNDPSYGSQWNMHKVRAPLAWDRSSGDPAAIIAILDTGIDLSHPDLEKNCWQNLGEILGNGVDDDGNGFVDDRWGWDVYNDDPTPQDDHGHGTHVAGIAGAAGNNGLGVAGLMWSVRIMPVKVLSASGSGSYAGVAEGAYYAVQNGARIVNMSLAGADFSQILQDAITDLYLRYGVAFVAAAGNCANGGPSCGAVNPVMFPASMDHVISVASTDSGDQRASTSEYNRFVDIAAPGQSVYSTGLGGGYRYMSGTSMAAPHVSALAALVRSLRPEWNPVQVEEHLKATAVKVGSAAYDESGRNDFFGYGRIDAANALWLLDPPHLTTSVAQIVGRIVVGEPIAASVTVTNTCGALVPWSVEMISGGDWLTVVPPDGLIAASSSSVLNLLAPEDMEPGLYRARFRITSTHPFWDGDAPVVDVYLLILRQENRSIFPFVFL